MFFTLVLYLLYDGHLNRFYDLVPREGPLPLLTLPTLFAVSILFVSVFGVIVLGIIALYMSNQIAGPLYRTKQSLARLGQGDLAFKLQFRHGDFLNDFPEIFNAMLERLRRQGVEELDGLKAIETSADDASEVTARVPPPKKAPREEGSSARNLERSRGKRGRRAGAGLGGGALRGRELLVPGGFLSYDHGLPFFELPRCL